VGVLEQDLSETAPLEKKPGVSFEKILQAVAAGSVEADLISSLASRLARIDRRIGALERAALAKLAGGRELAELAHDLVEALDPDRQMDYARHDAKGADPTPAQIANAEAAMLREVVKPIAANPELRKRLIEVRRSLEVSIDEISKDEITAAGFAPEIKQTHAAKLVQSFEAFLAEHTDEIAALQVLYSRPYHFAGNAELSLDDLAQVPFTQMGGVGRAFRVFGGDEIGRVIEELNEVLAA
jgi:type I restriction enzyme R subunit